MWKKEDEKERRERDGVEWVDEMNKTKTKRVKCTLYWRVNDKITDLRVIRSKCIRNIHRERTFDMVEARPIDKTHQSFRFWEADCIFETKKKKNRSWKERKEERRVMAFFTWFLMQRNCSLNKRTDTANRRKTHIRHRPPNNGKMITSTEIVLFFSSSFYFSFIQFKFVLQKINKSNQHHRAQIAERRLI